MKAVEISDDETKNVFLFSLLEREEIQFIDPPTTTNPYGFTQLRHRTILVADEDYERAIRIVADFRFAPRACVINTDDHKLGSGEP